VVDDTVPIPESYASPLVPYTVQEEQTVQTATKKRSRKAKTAPDVGTHPPQQVKVTSSKGKRKGAMTEPGREKTKSVRKLGACVRCKMYKISVRLPIRSCVVSR
jgi:hypothetical protein